MRYTFVCVAAALMLPLHKQAKRLYLTRLQSAVNFLFPGNSAVDLYQKAANYCENIPLSGAAQFVGRSQEIQKLKELLQQEDGQAIAVIVGMGGVGKTELANQYAWQHLETLGDRAGGVCWIDAREIDIGIQFVNFARSFFNLNPPEDWDIKTQLNYCWRNWQSGNWLIVIDDVTDYRKQVKPYLPPQTSPFKILLTTREKLGSSLATLSLDELKAGAALDLLISLVGAERIQPELEIAQQICNWLGNLPLGLELVGRYLYRDPDLSLKAMLSLLEKKRLRHRSVVETDATMTAKLGVADAFDLSWERLDENAQQLGYALSLFALADIPWSIIKQGYSRMLSLEDTESDLDILELEEARGNLFHFNLLQRTGKKTYSLHPLIREFLREKREQSSQNNDIKGWFVSTMVVEVAQIPNSPTRQQIQAIAPAIPHVAEVAKDKELIDLLLDELVIIYFVGLGRFYKVQALYDQAIPWLEKCLSVTQARFGSDHLDVAISLDNLAALYQAQGRYREAELLLKQALELKKRLVGEEHADIIPILNNLATLYGCQGRYSEAEHLHMHTLEMSKRLLGDADPYVATSLNNLASLYKNQGRYSEAEALYIQSLELKKYLHGEDHADVAITLNSLANLYEYQGRYSEAEPMYVKALELNKRLLGDDHPEVAASLNNLANLYESQKRYSEAETLYVQALELRQSLLGDNHPDVAQSLNNLAALYHSQRHYSKAELLYLQALEQRKCLLGETHPDVAQSLNNLGSLYLSRGDYTKAEPMLKKALEIWKTLLGEDHPDVATCLSNLADLYYSKGRYSEAEPLFAQALEIFQRHFGSNHPNTVICRTSLTILRRDFLKSAGRELPNFKHKPHKSGTKKKPKGFGKA